MTFAPFRRGFLWLLPLALLAGAGCKPSGRAAVTGTVSYDDGKPVTAGQVILQRSDDPKAPSVVGYIQPDGSFTLFTDKPGDGAPVGKYKVAVQPPGDEYNARNPRPIDVKFADPDSSGIAFEVKPGPNTLPITVHRPGAGRRP